MDELPKKISIWTPTLVFYMVLILTSGLLSLRLIFDATSRASSPSATHFPLTLIVIAGVIQGLTSLEKKEQRKVGIITLVFYGIAFLLLVASYLIS